MIYYYFYWLANLSPHKLSVYLISIHLLLHLPFSLLKVKINSFLARPIFGLNTFCYFYLTSFGNKKSKTKIRNNNNNNKKYKLESIRSERRRRQSTDACVHRREGAGNNVEIKHLVSSGSISFRICFIGFRRRRCRPHGGKLRSRGRPRSRRSHRVLCSLVFKDISLSK